MKKLLFVVTTLALVLSACSPAVHLQLARAEDNGTSICPDWSELERCYTAAQSIDPGPSDNPTTIPIKTWEVGRVQLRHAYISASWGLEWFDEHGNPVETADMVEGNFYTFHRTNIISGFELVRTP